MNKVSKKRKEQMIRYKEAKKELFLLPLKQGKLKCFFSNKLFIIPAELKFADDDTLIKIIECHHIYGERENEHLFDKEVMQPVFRYYHTKYHNTNIHNLMKEQWFVEYMNRIKITHLDLWEKELIKLKK